jgi:RNA polymerase sigma-70 factor (ECF subfamily)
LAAWLRQILKHNLLDVLRDQRRDKRDVRRDRPLEGAIDASFSHTEEWLAAVQSSPSQKAVQQEDLLRLSEALNLLSDNQREAIVLHYLQGLKLADVAVQIGRSESAVAGLLFRGLAKLHALLDE